jgi:acyl carrier protein
VSQSMNVDIADTVLTYIRRQLAAHVSNLDRDTMLFGEGHLDSTAMLELILWIGDTFNITIQNDDLTPENFATVRNIVDFVQRSRNAPVEAESAAAAPVGND